MDQPDQRSASIGLGISRPSKEEVRRWLDSRRRIHQPLPDIAEIQRQLDWNCHVSNTSRRDRG